ncbi:MAG TPA: 5-formyltetrahydrofolate cyclo-ligase [Motilibacteraceae bacterium]|nr:5-formyltetrahydrofolate cyclo-ligase [Motilibacteraceae bacterium]
MAGVPGATGDKDRLRRELLAARTARPAEERSGAAQALADRVLALAEVAGLPGGSTVTGYVSVGGEPSTSALLAALAARGLRVLLPLLLPDGDLDWAAMTLGEDGTPALQPGPRGLLEPAGARLGPAAVTEADVLVVPGLAAGRDGLRMGRGGGSYDRALARARPSALRVLLLWDGELLERVPAQPHDEAVDVVVTPTSAVRLRPPDAQHGSDRA